MQKMFYKTAASVNICSAMEQRPLQKREASENSIVKSRNKFTCLSGLLVLVLTLGLFSGCGDSKHPSKLVGKWERTGGSIFKTDDDGHVHYTVGSDRIEFLKDGKVLYQEYGWWGYYESVPMIGQRPKRIFSWGDTETTTWEVSDKRLFLHNYQYEDTYIFDYQVSGSELRLTKPDSDRYATYRKTKTFNENLNSIKK